MPEIPCCPTCGSAIRPSEIIVNLNENIVISPIGSARITPKQAELVEALHRSMPLFVHQERLYGLVWGAYEPADVDNTLKVYISRLRKILTPIGIKIENRTGCGYRMVLMGKEEKASEDLTSTERITYANAGAGWKSYDDLGSMDARHDPIIQEGRWRR